MSARLDSRRRGAPPDDDRLGWSGWLSVAGALLMFGLVIAVICTLG